MGGWFQPWTWAVCGFPAGELMSSVTLPGQAYKTDEQPRKTALWDVKEIKGNERSSFLTVLYQVTCWSLGHCTPRWKMKGSQTLQGSRERFGPLSGSPLSTAHCLPLGNHHLIYRHSLVCCSPPFPCQWYSNWGVSLPSTAACVSPRVRKDSTARRRTGIEFSMGTVSDLHGKDCWGSKDVIHRYTF